MAVLLILAAVVCGLAAFVTGNLVYGGIAGAALAAALWLYQAAQLLHIRALLAKSDARNPALEKPAL